MTRSRREFPRSIKVAVIKRANHGGAIYCERCGLPAKKFQIDHIVADAIGGEPVIGNAELICDVCFGIKNPHDTRLAAKSKRREAKFLGVSKTAARPIQQPSKQQKPGSGKLPVPPPRNIYERA